MEKSKIKEIKEVLIELIKKDSDVRKEICSLKKDENSMFGFRSMNNDSDKREIERLKSELFGLKQEKDSLIQELSEVREDLSEAEQDKKRLKGKLSELTEQNDRLSDELSKAKKDKDRFEQQCSKLQETFGKYLEVEIIFSKYKKLDEDIRKSYRTIINDSSWEGFLISGAEFENIELFFQKVCMEYRKYNDNTLGTLNEVFDYLFEQFRINHKDYSRISTEIGQNFDLDSHTRTSDSSPVGRVKRVIIKGYKNTSGTKKAKSFVEIR